MRLAKSLILGGLLIAASSVSAAGGGGCLAGRYQYFDGEGQLVGSETVGCPNNSAWGEVTDDAVFAPGCLDES